MSTWYRNSSDCNVLLKSKGLAFPIRPVYPIADFMLSKGSLWLDKLCNVSFRKEGITHLQSTNKTGSLISLFDTTYFSVIH